MGLLQFTFRMTMTYMMHCCAFCMNHQSPLRNRSLPQHLAAMLMLNALHR